MRDESRELIKKILLVSKKIKEYYEYLCYLEKNNQKDSIEYVKRVEFIKAFKNVTNKDVKEAFSEMLMGIDEEEFGGTYRINFYTDKGIFKKKLLSIRQEIIQDGIKMTFSIDKIDDNEMIIGINSMGISYSIKVKRNNSNLNLSIRTDMLGMYYNIDMSLNYEKLNEIKKPDISNYKKIDDLSEKEKKEIEEKLVNNEVLNKLIEEIKKNTPKVEVAA